mgnify:CR=1 FL=1
MISESIKEFFNLKQEIKDLEEKVSELKDERNKKELAIIEEMENQGISEIGVDGIGKVFIKPKIHYSYLVEHQGEVISYFKNDPQLRPFVKESIHHATFQKALEGIYEKTNTIPLPNIIKSFPKKSILTRKAKGGQSGSGLDAEAKGF